MTTTSTTRSTSDGAGTATSASSTSSANSTSSALASGPVGASRVDATGVGPTYAPPLPPARFVDLSDDERGDLGTIVARDLGPTGPDARSGTDRTPVMLLHGWTATADINWYRCYEPLAVDRRVVAHDHRGHGSGIRTRKRFRLEDCADDAIAVADRLGIDRFIACGYSMGGPVAQLVWRRHPDRVAGLVLCATAAQFSGHRAERWSFLGLTGLAALARITPTQAREWL
ncbi:MAG: alpha/beta hydrolase, partial [Actinomycetota bacterium]